MATKETYQVTGTDLNGVLLRINSVMARIADRLDKLEGFRGELETASGTFTGDITTTGVIVNDDDDRKLHSME